MDKVGDVIYRAVKLDYVFAIQRGEKGLVELRVYPVADLVATMLEVV
jgi:hypothetical protein